MRRIAPSVLVVVGSIVLMLASFGWWANRYLLNSGNFADGATKILQQDEVQNALAVVITDKISDASGRDLNIARPFVTTIVRGVVESDPFQKVFKAAVFRAHRAVVDGGARDVVLDLSETVDRVRDALEPVAPNLAAKIPSGQEIEVRVLQKSELETVYDVTKLIKDLTLALTVTAVAFLAGGIALSTRRWQTVALAGWLVFGAFTFLLVVVVTGRIVTGWLISNDDYSSAAQAAYKVVTRGLVVQGIVVAVIASLVAVVAGWIDRTGGWATARETARRALVWTRAQVPEKPVPVTGETGAAFPADAVSTPVAAAEATPPPLTPIAAATVQGVLAARLPEPPRRARRTHWWRAAGLLAVGLFAVFSPGSLTTLVVIGLGLAAIYLAVTEAVAAWASPREPQPET